MPKPRPENIIIERTRHGRAVYYYRLKKGPRIRLPDTYGSPEFMTAYYAAAAAFNPPPAKKTVKCPVGTNKQMIEAAMKEALARAKSRASGRDWGFDLTLEWALFAIEEQEFKCALTDIPFFAKHERERPRHPYAPSIDRKDCDRGYTMDNCRIILMAVNLALSDWGDEVFRRIAFGYARKNRLAAPATEKAPSLPTPCFRGDLGRRG